MKLWEGLVLTKYSHDFDLAVHTFDQAHGIVGFPLETNGEILA
jgi:hypothetical protein